ncbi:hypothetical protein L484_007977 [Morus notabilis]|uniref:Uncharacterized protein n=1 Tax=Morus notabilis TaxID=981085 RepID=W9QQ11_9ROSA|nr:hypothetical protein L484_007977 [Morus notabilis]
MAFITGLSTVVVILMVASLPFLQSSPPRFQAETTMAENKATLQGLTNRVDIFGNGDSVIGVDEESERQVPTGPDPLHHNNHPTRP